MPLRMLSIAVLSLLVGLVPARADGPRPLSPNCQAKLPLTEEVVRLLTKAASHATESAACVDGPGERVTVDEVLVCPAGSSEKALLVDASYRVTRWAEGDTRGCRKRPQPRPAPAPRPKQAAPQNGPAAGPRAQGRGGASEVAAPSRPDLCSGTPGKSRHRMRFRFLRRGRALVIELPAAIDGLEGMTPLDQVHSGGCYGESGPFKPARIRL